MSIHFQRGTLLSAGIHVTLLIIAFLGLPDWFEKTEPQPLVVTLEMLPITGVTNVKPSDKPVTKPQEKPPVAAPTPPKPPTSKPTPPPPPPAPKPPAPTPPPAPEKPVPEKPVDKPKPEVKKKIEPPKPPAPPAPAKPIEKTPAKPEEPSLDEVLKDVQNQARTTEDKAAKPTDKPPVPVANTTQSTAPYDPTQPLSLSERDAIVSQFIQCWKLPAGSANDYSLKVGVDVALRPDGSVISAALAMDQRGRYGSDQVFRAAADSAVRAVYKCNPIKNLPTNKYNSWKEMRLNFDPSMQLY